MSNFFKLLHFEMKRFKKFYSLLLLIVLLFQMGTVLVFTFSFKAMLKNSNMGIETLGLFNFEMIGYSLPFILPVFIAFVAMLFYTFFIWYRDWFARNTFIYRLLTLPTSRFNIYFAKLTTIILYIFGLVAYQMVLFSLYRIVVKLILPNNAIGSLNVTTFYLDTLFPAHIIDFAGTYLGVIVGIVIIFTMILLERSFRLIGIVIAIFYFIIMMVLLATPSLIQFFMKEYFYIEEMYLLHLVSMVVITLISLLIGRYLLKYKVTV